MRKNLQVLFLTFILIFTLTACSNNQTSNATTNTIASPEATSTVLETIAIPEALPTIAETVKPQVPTAAPVAAVVTKAIVAEQPKAVMVHITKTGEKYHNAGCRYLAKSDIEVTLSTAISKGLTPCSVCKPPTK